MDYLIERTKILTEKLGLKFKPVALLFADAKPESSIYLKKAGSGCIAPLIFSASKGKTVSIDKDSTGFACSAFYLGYAKWIFNGIEYFLSHEENGVELGRECERFVNSPEQAKAYVESFIPTNTRENTLVFKPVEELANNEKPEVIILFANPDQISALVFLIQYNYPNSFDRIVTGFASSCAAMTTFPLQYAKEGINKAFWGLHDPAQRLSFPENITSLSMPYQMYSEICQTLEDTFLYTTHWDNVLNRINSANNS